MKIPNQIIPESQKTKAFIEKTIKAIALQCKSSSQGKKSDYDSWMLYNERFDERELDFLRKVGEYVLPAQFRWIGVQRPKINLLASQESKRPWVYTIRMGDKDSQKEKINEKSRFLISQVQNQVKEKKIKLLSSILMLQQQIAQIEQYLQQEPQNEEMAAQMQQIAMQLPQVKLVINKQKERLNTEVLYTDKEIKELDIYLRMTWQDKKEMYAQILTDKMKLKLRLKDKKIEGLIATCVTGKSNYFVDYRKGKLLPDFENIDDVKVYYPKISNIDFIQDGPWVAIEEGYSVDKLVSMLSDELTSDDIKELESGLSTDYYEEDTSNLTKKEATLTSNNGYEGSEILSSMIRVWRVYYKSPRKIYIKSSPNPYKEGAYYRHFIGEDDVYKVKKDKGDKLDIRYVTDIYEGIYVERLQKVYKAQKKEYCRTYIDDYTKKDLPVYGYTFSRLSKKPYSLIQATKELQKLINILHYHRELLLALAGTRGTVIDLSQIPKGMSPEEHQYHKKKGALYIQTVSKGGRKINSSFNQWQQYDETLSPAIQYLDSMIFNTDAMIGHLMGIGPQRMGQVVQGDQVGKTEMSIQQNALITEIIYYNHDQIFGKAFEAALNLATKYCMHEGGIISRDDATQGEQHVIVPKDMFKNVEFEMNIENTTEEESSLNTLKQLAMQNYMAGKLPFSNIVSMYRVKSLKELETKYEYFEEKAMEAAQAAAQENLQMQSQLEAQKVQMENEYKMTIENQKIELEKMSKQIELQKFEFERQKLGAELEMKDKEIRSKMITEVYKTDKDHNVEMAYLAEQERRSVMDEQLREIQLKVDVMFKQMELNLAQTKQTYDVFKEKDKIRVEERKIGMQPKERIKD